MSATHAAAAPVGFVEVAATDFPVLLVVLLVAAVAVLPVEVASAVLLVASVVACEVPVLLAVLLDAGVHVAQVPVVIADVLVVAAEAPVQVPVWQDLYEIAMAGSQGMAPKTDAEPTLKRDGYGALAQAPSRPAG